MNRPLALRGHVTNASFQKWVGILLMPKMDRAHKNYLTPEIWEETHLREIFYSTLIFNNLVWLVLAAMLEGILLPSNMTAKPSFCLYLVKHLIVMLRCAVNVTTSFFSTFFLKFKWKICVQKEVIHDFKNHILVTWPDTNLLILRKWCGFEKPNHHYFIEDMTL